jgi:hypothetical protein
MPRIIMRIILILIFMLMLMLTRYTLRQLHRIRIILPVAMLMVTRAVSKPSWSKIPITRMHRHLVQHSVMKLSVWYSTTISTKSEIEKESSLLSLESFVHASASKAANSHISFEILLLDNLLVETRQSK